MILFEGLRNSGDSGVGRRQEASRGGYEVQRETQGSVVREEQRHEGQQLSGGIHALEAAMLQEGVRPRHLGTGRKGVPGDRVKTIRA